MNRLVQRLLLESRPSDFLDSRIRRSLGLVEKEVVDKEEWEKRVDSQNVEKELMNDLVMDYLAIECSKEAVDHFRNEANCKAKLGRLLEFRDSARMHFINNEIGEVINILESENPDIHVDNPELILELKLVNLIWLCESKKSKQAVDFVKNEISNTVGNKGKLRPVLEKILLLLIFDDIEAYPYLDMIGNLREETLIKVNQELLRIHNDMLEPKLIKIFKVMRWMETKLGEKVDFPKMEKLNGNFMNEESQNQDESDNYSSVSSFEDDD